MKGTLRGALAACLTALFGGLAPSATSAEETIPVRLETSLGDIDLALDPGKAPRTVANFLGLVDDGFFDGLIFHRVIAGFMIQGGGFDAQYSQRQPPNTVVNESDNGLSNRRASIAMARTPDPDSAGSQFFINLVDNLFLDAKPAQPGYTVFGEVTAGMEVADRIASLETGQRSAANGQNLADVPLQAVVIQRAMRLGVAP